MKRLSAVINENISNQGANGFVILKPGFEQHEEALMKMLENNGWKIIQKKKQKLTKDQAHLLYLPHKDKDFYNDLCDYMCSDSCTCCTCHKECKDPIKEMSTLKDKVRKEWGKDEMKNCMHSSDSLQNVAREAKICIEGCVNESFLDEYYPYEEVDPKVLIIEELYSLYAEEVNAWYQYFCTAEWLVGAERANIAMAYQKFAYDELYDHAQALMRRINELGNPGLYISDLYNLNNIAKGKYIQPDSSYDTEVSLQQNIDAELLAISHYESVEKLTRDIDPVTNDLIKRILKDEIKHKRELSDFRNDIIQIKLKNQELNNITNNISTAY